MKFRLYLKEDKTEEGITKFLEYLKNRDIMIDEDIVECGQELLFDKFFDVFENQKVQISK